MSIIYLLIFYGVYKSGQTKNKIFFAIFGYALVPVWFLIKPQTSLWKSLYKNVVAGTKLCSVTSNLTYFVLHFPWITSQTSLSFEKSQLLV